MLERDTHVLDTLKVSSYVASMDHDVFIDENIEDEAYYRSVISTLNKASEKDTIRFIISSNGGFGSTAMVLAHAMDSCPAHKIGVLSGNCKSAATIIALHCDSWEVGVGCDWMAHTASFGLGGSAHVVQKYHDHEQKQIRKLLFREYLGFYTEEEIEQIAKGDDSLLDDKEVTERLQSYAEYRVTRQQSDMEDMFEEQNSQMDKYQNILLDKAVKEGKLTQQEVDIALKVQGITEDIDESISDDELESLMNGEDSPKNPDPINPTGLVIVKDIEGKDWYLNKDLILWWDEDYTKYSGPDVSTNLHSKEEIEETLVVEEQSLKCFAKGFGIKFPHNISEDKLHQKIIDFFQEKWDNQNKY